MTNAEAGLVERLDARANTGCEMLLWDQKERELDREAKAEIERLTALLSQARAEGREEAAKVAEAYAERQILDYYKSSGRYIAAAIRSLPIDGEQG